MEQPTYRHKSEVAFSDTDASGWAHFSKILCYVENAEHAFLKSIAIPVFSNIGGFPRVNISCNYRSPLKFQDSFEVILHLTKIGTTSIHWNFQIQKTDTTLAAEGEMTTVKVDPTGTPTPLTESERTKLT